MAGAARGMGAWDRTCRVTADKGEIDAKGTVIFGVAGTPGVV